MRIELSTFPINPEVANVSVSEYDLPNARLDFSHSFSIKDLYLTRPDKPFNHSAEEAGKYKFKAIRDYGKRLFKSLFPSDPKTPSQKLWTSLSSQSGRILLIIRSNDPTFNLDEIPWEYAYADAPLVAKYNFVRMTHTFRRQDELQFKPPLHLVLVAPDPIILPTCGDANELPALYLDEQYMNFINCFKSGKKTLTLERVFPATLGSLKDIIGMKDTPKPVLHFMGHCTMIDEEPALLFEKEGGSVHYINSRDLAAMANFHFVFLAGCQTYKLARNLIENGVVYTIGSYCEIPDYLIRQFEITFYQELSRGHSIELAFRKAHQSEDLSEDNKSKFTGSMILYSATYQEKDGEFEYKQGEPIIKENFPSTNLEINRKAKFWGRKRDLLNTITALNNISTRASQRYQLHTIRGVSGQGKTTLMTQAVYRTAFAFPGGIYMRSFKKMPRAAEYFKDLARTLFDGRKDALREILECGDNKIDDLKTVVTRTLKSHQAKGTCLLILDHAESLKHIAETEWDQDSDAVTLWNWLHKTAAGISGVVLLATSTEYLGWMGESQQELKGMVDDENIQPAAKLFCQWAESRKRDEIDQEPKKDELLQELVKAIKGNPKSLEELGRKFGSPAYSDKSLADLITDLNHYGYVTEKKTSTDINIHNSSTASIVNNSQNEHIQPLTLLSPRREVTAPRKGVFWVPHQRNAYFVDRSNVFEDLHRVIKKNKEGIECKPISLCGLGGMGKTEIAIEYCYRSHANYQYILWMRADTEATIQESFVETARVLHLDISPNATHDTYVCEVIGWFQCNESWLLVIDNADDCSLGDESNSSHLQKYIPRIGQGDILVTTRGDFINNKELVINLDEMKMDDETALKLLLRNMNVSDDNSCAIAIIRELGYLPLAIDLAGACMEVENLTPIDFLKRYQDDPASYLDREEVQKRTGSWYGKTVLTVWNVSFDSIRRRNPRAASLLQSFAFLCPDDIPFDLFQKHSQTIFGLDKAMPTKDLTDNILCLGRFSFVRQIHRDAIDKSGPAKRTLSIHRLVQTVILLKMELEEKIQYCERFISALNQEMASGFQLENKKFQRTMEDYVPHVQHVVLQFTQHTSEAQWLAISAELTSVLLPSVAYLTRQALFENVEHLAELAISSSTIANGRGHSDTAIALSNLSYLYKSQLNFKAAEPCGKEAFEIRKTLLGLDDNDTIASLYSLIYIYQALGKESEVTLLYLDAANADDRVAQKELARRYHEGIGVAKDYEAACYWILKSENSEPPRPRKIRKLDHIHTDNRFDLTPLHHAVMKLDVSSIRNHVTGYIPFANVRDKNGLSPLHWAAEGGHVEMIRLLVIEIGANVKASNNDGWTPIHEAVAKGHLEVVKVLVTEFGADVNAKDNNGWTPIHKAAANGYVRMIKLLAGDLGAIVTTKSESGRTPLHEAAANGYFDIVELLANDFGADVNAETEFGRTPLYGAAENGHIDVVRLLVSMFGANVNTGTKYGRTPLLLAAESGHAEVVRLLVTEFQADVNAMTKNGQTTLHYLAQDGCTEVLRLLVNKFKADPEVKGKDGRTPLHFATAKGHVGMVKLLASEFRVDVNAQANDGRTPLHVAAEKGHIKVVNVLAGEFGACVKSDKTKLGRTPLQMAAENGHTEIVRLLLAKFGADANAKTKNSETPLHYIAQDQFMEVAELLIEKFGADANAKDDKGQTPLHWAAANGQVKIVRLLVTKFRANLTIKENDGLTPLHQAAKNGHLNVVMLLIAELGAGANTKSNDGWTPLHWAAENGHLEVVKLLMTELKADSNIQANTRWTPLHCAAENGHIEVVKLLMNRFRANINAKGNDGQTPLHGAAEYGHVDMVKVLFTEFGADVNLEDNRGRTPLHGAAENKHINVVNALIDKCGADANAKDSSGRIPLHYLARDGHLEVVKKFITKFKVDVNAKDINGRTSLHRATENGHVQVVRLLVDELEADVNIKAKDGWTPLHWAVENKHISVMRLLVTELRADVNAKDELGRTPLHRASENGHIEVVRVLVAELGADFDIKANDESTPLHHLARNGHVEAVRLLVIDFGANFKIKAKDGRTPHHWAKENNHVKVTELLELVSDFNAKENDSKCLPLYWAAMEGRIQIVRSLVTEFRSDVNIKDKYGRTPLHGAVQNRHIDIIKMLVTEFGADSTAENKNGETPLHQAADKGDVEVVRLLITKPEIDHNGKDSNGRTPLHRAIAKGHLEVLKLLISIGVPEILDFNSIIIDNEIIYALAEFLKQNIALTQLNLKSNSIGNKGACTLAKSLKWNMTLTKLNLSENGIGAEGACTLAESLKQNITLTELNLSWNGISNSGARALAKSLKQNTTLIKLNLERNSIGDLGAHALAESLKQNTTLTKLNLENNDIGNSGSRALAKSLKQNMTLAELNLELNGIGTEGAYALAESLRQNITLTELNLERNSIGAKGACTLAESLKQNMTLTKLNLGSNNIGTKGACALAKSLKQNITLTKLNLEKNGISAKGAYNLAESLKQNITLTKLNLFWNGIGNSGACALAESLKQNIALTELILPLNGISAKGAYALTESLKQNITLTKLNLGLNGFLGNGIGAEGAHMLAESLKQNTTLIELNIERNSISDSGACALVESLKQNMALTELNLSWNSIGNSGACALAESLKQNITLTKLNLEKNNIGDEGAFALAKSLKQNKTLNLLNLELNNIGNKGAHPLAESLNQNMTLTKLNLRNNKISEADRTSLSAPILSATVYSEQFNVANPAVPGRLDMGEQTNEARFFIIASRVLVLIASKVSPQYLFQLHYVRQKANKQQAQAQKQNNTTSQQPGFITSVVGAPNKSPQQNQQAVAQAVSNAQQQQQQQDLRGLNLNGLTPAQAQQRIQQYQVQAQPAWKQQMSRNTASLPPLVNTERMNVPMSAPMGQIVGSPTPNKRQRSNTAGNYSPVMSFNPSVVPRIQVSGPTASIAGGIGGQAPGGMAGMGGVGAQAPVFFANEAISPQMFTEKAWAGKPLKKRPFPLVQRTQPTQRQFMQQTINQQPTNSHPPTSRPFSAQNGGPASAIPSQFAHNLPSPRTFYPEFYESHELLNFPNTPTSAGGTFHWPPSVRGDFTSNRSPKSRARPRENDDSEESEAEKKKTRK